MGLEFATLIFNIKKAEVKKGRTTLPQPILTKYPIIQFKPPVCFDAFYASKKEIASSNAYFNNIILRKIFQISYFRQECQLNLPFHVSSAGTLNRLPRPLG